jgi:hypothetical protein
MIRIGVAAGMALALAACGDDRDDAPANGGVTIPLDDGTANTVEEIEEPANVAPPEPPAPPAANTAAPVEESAIAGDTRGPIPAPLRGKWALARADCARPNADSVLEVGASELHFYESVAKLGSVKEREASRIRAAFTFSGEGETWSRDIVLDGQDAGRTLIRREYGQDAAPGAFRYVKCPA